MAYYNAYIRKTDKRYVPSVTSIVVLASKNLLHYYDWHITLLRHQLFFVVVRPEGIICFNPRASIGLLTLLSWETDSLILTSWQSWRQTRNPVTAKLSLLFSIALGLRLLWFNGIERYLQSKTPKPENLNSRFGTWLTINSPIKKGNYILIFKQHQKLMALAKTLIDLHENGQTQAALARLPDLKKIQEDIFEKLKLLIEENWK